MAPLPSYGNINTGLGTGQIPPQMAPYTQPANGRMTATQGMPAYGATYDNVTQPAQSPQNAGSADTSSGWDSLLNSMIGTGVNMYGTQNAAEAATHGNLDAINTQKQTMGNINSIYGTQSDVGNQALSTLGRMQGGGGTQADYSNFLNMPGYQFAVDQGMNAIRSGAAASGNAYTPNTLINAGKFVTGTAMQDYNTYVNQLLQTAQFGQNANQGRAGAQMGTGANISQLQSNIGQNQAGGYTGGAGFLGGMNASGVGNLVNQGIGLLGKGLGYLGSKFGGGGDTSGYSGVNTGTDASGGYYDSYGNYTPQGSNDFGQGNTPADMNSGYDNSQTDYSQSSGAYGGPG